MTPATIRIVVCTVAAAADPVHSAAGQVMSLQFHPFHEALFAAGGFAGMCCAAPTVCTCLGISTAYSLLYLV